MAIGSGLMLIPFHHFFSSPRLFRSANVKAQATAGIKENWVRSAETPVFAIIRCTYVKLLLFVIGAASATTERSLRVRIGDVLN
jgi:hypothetical protein